MATKGSQVAVYSLGLEELALAFGLINRNDLGAEVLAAIYDDLSQEQKEARLTSASHSLLARGLTSISEKGTPIIDQGLEKALFPLAKFDRLLQVSLVINEGQVNMTIHIQKGRAFTSHLVKAGIVHVLANAPLAELTGYLLDIFEQVGISHPSKEIKAQVTPGLLGKALGQKNEELCKTVLTEAGWPAGEATFLAEDLTHQILRTTLMKVEAGESTPLETIQQTEQENMMVLQGKSRSWAFRFPSSKDDTIGIARLVDRPAFEKLIRSLTA